MCFLRCMRFLLTRMIPRQQLLLFCLTMAAFFSFTATAPANNTHTVVVSDTHATQLIQQYLKSHPNFDIHLIQQAQIQVADKLNQLQQALNQKINQKLLETVIMQTPQAAALPKIYPIRSSCLTPGKVKARAIQTTLPEPIFIVGDDTASKTWIKRYQQRLLTLQAKGFVVNVGSKKAMDALRQQFPQLPLMPIPGDTVAKWLHLNHYPVLISAKLIEQ